MEVIIFLLYIYLWIRGACVKELLSLLDRKQVKAGIKKKKKLNQSILYF